MAGSIRRAFSLVELLLVVVVIGIIAAIAVPEFSKARGDTMDGAREAAMHNVAKALESYYSRHGRYPTTGGQWSGDTSSYGGKGYGADGYIPGLVPEFIKSLPRDPDKNYPAAGKGYLYRSDGANYKFLAWNTPTVFSENHPLYDPVRPTSSWQISTFGAKNW